VYYEQTNGKTDGNAAIDDRRTMCIAGPTVQPVDRTWRLREIN